jgi:hypothetical protein
MSNPRPLARRASVASQFRGEIEKAEANGVSRDSMTLKLNLSDVSQLKRDRTIAVSDISFVDGVMRYLGVKVIQGGVDASVLSLTAED